LVSVFFHVCSYQLLCCSWFFIFADDFKNVLNDKLRQVACCSLSINIERRRLSICLFTQLFKEFISCQVKTMNGNILSNNFIQLLLVGCFRILRIPIVLFLYATFFIDLKIFIARSISNYDYLVNFSLIIYSLQKNLNCLISLSSTCSDFP